MKISPISLNYLKVSLISLFILFIASCSETTKIKDVDKKECPQNCEIWQECSENYECVLKTGACETETDCNTETPICNTEHLCQKKQEEVFCTLNKCQEWETCNEESDSCIPITGKCETDDDCQDNLTCNDNKYCSYIDSSNPDNSFIYTTINKLQTDNSFINKNVKTFGIVTAIALSQARNPKGLYIQFSQEKHSGIYVYFIAAGPTDIKVGDLVKVTGVLDRNEGKARIRTRISDIELVRSGESPYTPIRVNYFTALTEYESMLTYIVIENRLNLRELLPEHFIFMDRNNNKVYVKDTISYLNHLALGIKIESLVGILDNYNGLARVLPRSEDDLIVYMPVCESACYEWEECLDRDLCVISAGRCALGSDCKNENSSCDENNYCEEPSILANGDIDEWSDGNPTGYIVGAALKATMEENKKESSNYGAKVERFEYLYNSNNKDTVEFLSPPVSVDYNKNYSLSLYVLDNDIDVDTTIYYEAYNVFDNLIGSAIKSNNDDFTRNIDNWIELTLDTNFSWYLWNGNLLEDISYIRFGIRLYKGHKDTDNTLPSGYEPSGTGVIYVDTLSITEIE